MLIRLSANRDEFTAINFKPGFNVIVADRDENSNAQNSRNARGKSTLLMLLNYALAGNLDSSLQPLADDDWEVTLTLEMFGGIVSATRALKGGKKISIQADVPASHALSSWLSEGHIALEDWKSVLGLALFGLEPESREIIGGISVRTLLSYVVRMEASSDPLKFFSRQSAVSSREHIAFLLNLDWKVVHELAQIKKGISQLNTITAATKEGLVATLRPEKELLLERAALKNEMEEWENRISGFQILEDPNSLVAQANELTANISRLRDEALVDQRMKDLYENSLSEAVSSAGNALPVEEIFEAANLVLTDGFKRQISEVRKFHDSLMANRRTFLREEVEILDQRIAERNENLTLLDNQREHVLRTLNAGGAFEELYEMRAVQDEVKSQMVVLDLQIKQAREIAARQDEFKLQQSEKRSQATHELAGSREKLDRVSDSFSQKMKQLYGKEAALTVTVDDNGYKFALHVAGSVSSGVSRMTLLCFDITLLEEGITTPHHPDFLVHDSSVFDGVDPRQRASAFQIVQETLQFSGGQYICTINSSDIPDEIREEDWFNAGVVRRILDTEIGGLTGREF